MMTEIYKIVLYVGEFRNKKEIEEFIFNDLMCLIRSEI